MGSSFKLDKNDFNKHVEEYKIKADCSYIDAILALCENHNIEPDTVGNLISQPIREKLQLEGQELNILPKSVALPLV